METLLRGMGGLRLDDSIDSVSDLLDTEPGVETLSQLLDSTQGLSCGPSHNSLAVERGLQRLSAGEPLEALHYLAEGHSTTLRQYMIMKSSCRLAQLQVKSGSRVDGWPAGTQEALLDTRRRQLQYRPDPQRRQEMLHLISQVPPDWTVIQLTATPRARSRLTRHNTPELVLARFQGGDASSLLLTRVPAPASDHCCTFLSEFDAMLADNGSIQRSLSNDRQKYWAERGLLDDRMKSIVRSMEVAWLGRHAYLLAGSLLRPAHRRSVSRAVSALPAPLTSEQQVRLSLLAACLPETAADLAAGVAAALGPAAAADQRRAVAEALAARRDELEDAAAGARRGQVILVLDREVQRYPWETVGALALGPVCRLPSLAILALCLASRKEGPPRPTAAAGSATYIVNPAGDLANTEQRMAPFLEDRGWSGIVGRPPTLKEFSAALTDGQIMAYCGHGSGSQYLPAEKLRSLNCNAVALLFGCSSGQLVQPGPTADPHGSVHAYLMANCPAILGNLWSVTDNTLDTYSKAVIEDWTDGAADRSLPEAVSAARGSVTSTFMAAAPVVYGLPVTADGIQLDRSKVNGTADRSKLNATADRSKLNATADRSKLNATADRSRLDTTVGRSKVGGTLADCTNTDSARDASRINLTRDFTREDKLGDPSRMDATQDSVRADPAHDRSRSEGTQGVTRTDAAENSKRKDAARSHLRIPTKVGLDRSQAGAGPKVGLDRSQAGAGPKVGLDRSQAGAGPKVGLDRSQAGAGPKVGLDRSQAGAGPKVGLDRSQAGAGPKVGLDRSQAGAGPKVGLDRSQTGAGPKVDSARPQSASRVSHQQPTASSAVAEAPGRAGPAKTTGRPQRTSRRI